MFDLDRWNEIWEALSKNKLRSVLTAFGVFWGIFMLIFMAGAGRGLENGIVEGVGAFSTNSCFMWTNRTSKPFKGFKRGRWWRLNNDDMQYLMNNVGEVEFLSPRLMGGDAAENTVRGLRTGTFHIKGDYPQYIDIDPVTMVKGRFINEIDILEKRKVCVIGERVFEAMFEKDEDPLGEYIRVSGVFYQVIGVLHPDTEVEFNGKKEESIFLPFTTLQQTFNFGDQVHFFAVTARKGIPVSSLEEKMKNIIKKRHDIAPDDKQALMSFNVEKQFIQMNMLFGGIKMLTWIVGIGTLLAGVIGVSNIMLVVVRERTKEIGIRRAIGATPRNVVSQIFQESILLTTIAGYIGILLGFGLLELISMVIEKAKETSDDIFISHPEITFSIALGSLIVLIFAGAFAGWLPARRAVRVRPIEALREE